MNSSWQIRPVAEARILKLVTFKVRLISRTEGWGNKHPQSGVTWPPMDGGGEATPGVTQGPGRQHAPSPTAGSRACLLGRVWATGGQLSTFPWLPALTPCHILLLEAQKSYREAGWPLGPLLWKGISNMTFPISTRLTGTVLAWDEQERISGSFWLLVDSPCNSRHAVSTDLYPSCVLNMNQNREEQTCSMLTAARTPVPQLPTAKKELRGGSQTSLIM